MLEAIISLLVIILVGYLIVKKFDSILALALGGFILLISAFLLKHPILDEKATTGLIFFDVFKMVEVQFLKNLGNIGLTIMTLFGYSAYMSKIGANDVTIEIMSKPLRKIKSKYLLIPVIFLLGNLMSLVIPSASSLSILLMATLFPILTSLEISPLAAAGVIATTATIMPTPLGADNVIAAEKFNVDVVDYVAQHAMISIPTLLFMAVVHYLWQKYLDDKEKMEYSEIKIDKKIEKVDKPFYYGVLPLLPLIFIIINNVFFKEIKIGLITITFICLIISVLIEILRKESVEKVSKDIKDFFNGMGNGVSMVVTILVAAGMLVEGLKALGIIDSLTNSITHLEQAGAIMTIGFSGITFIIGLLTGGGLSVFYATVELLPKLAASVNIQPQAISLPMQMVANLVRSISPVAAVIVIVSTTIKVSPTKLIKRTIVPVLAGIIFSLVLTFILLF